MARRLVKAGHRVTVVTGSASFPKRYELPDETSRLTLEGIELRVIRAPYSNKLSFTQRIVAFFRFALKASLEAARVDGVDVVFATSTPLTIAIPAVWAKRRLGAPMVFEVRDLWPELPIALGALNNPVAQIAARWLERFAYRNAERIVALSPGMKDGIVRVDGRPDRVTVVPNSSDIELFRIPSSEGERYLQENPHLRGTALILYGGTHGIVNGVDYLVETAAEIQKLDPGVKFLFVGDGNRKEVAVARAKELGVYEKTVWFIPPVKKTEMPRIVSASTVTVSTVIDVPELRHNSANKFFDSLAAERPMMINHEGWLADLIRESGAGLVTPPRDSKAAARALHAFLSDKDGLRKSREAAKRLADEEFSRDKLFARLLGVLEAARGV